jgi:putative transposase
MKRRSLSFANKPSDGKQLTDIETRANNDAMPTLLLCVFRFVRLLWSGHQSIAIENAALRLQLRAFQRTRKRPMLTMSDRLFWSALARLWSGWRDALVIVQPETVVRWQHERFRRFWARLSKTKGRTGRPCIPTEVRRLVMKMALDNTLWRAPRIHGELQMLGIAVSERPVSRILRTLPRGPSQSWKTFLSNHIGQIVSVDFFAVPTITLRVLFVFVVIAHRRREVLHFNVTDHPTAEWIAQQVIEACAYRDMPRYLTRDRDRVYGTAVRLQLQALGIQEVLTAPASPWQNAYAERLIGSIRRECLNHFVILNARHLKRTLASYFDYYQRSRTHSALAKNCPIPRAISGQGKIAKIPYLGGLHHRYTRIAA